MEQLPQHIAVIMDGNGRWAAKRSLPRIAGHKKGLDAVRGLIKHCVSRKITVLTLFAFSSENWRRPFGEVSFLMDLFLRALEKETQKLHKENIQLRVIGDRSRLAEKLQKKIKDAENLTQNNTGLKLVIASNYGGRWDICNAVKHIAEEVKNNQIEIDQITDELLNRCFALGDLPPPDLFIRTSGEQRLSNFLLWQLAYTELYFTDTYWPDFNEFELEKALAFFAKRERRFGQTSEQIGKPNYA